MSGLLEQVLPHYDQRERHSRLVAAPPEEVWRALDELSVGDLAISMALMRLRGGPSAWLRGMDLPTDTRAIDAFAPTPLVVDPPRELLLADIGTYGLRTPAGADVPRGDRAAFEAFDEPGFSKVAMNFLLIPQSGGTLVSTETRVRSTDPVTRRRFWFYWALIRAGSGLVRHDVLNGIARTVK